MNIYDISVTISDDMITWPADPKVEISKMCSIEQGSVCNVTGIKMGAHTGTHIDAPNHFLDDSYTTDNIKLEDLIGKCIVIESGAENLIGIDDVNKYDYSSCNKVLIKTKNSKMLTEGTFNKEFVSIGNDAIKYLIAQNVKLIGIDYLSVEAFNSDGRVHKEILKNEVIILECIDLSLIKSGIYELICLPLKLSNSDGAPVRAILRDIKGK